MIVWTDESSSRGRFLSGSAPREMPVREALLGLFDVLLGRVLSEAGPERFDLLMLEVACDTGRLIAGASTHERWKKGLVQGCSVRVQALQDFWYDLVEAKVGDAALEVAVNEQVGRLGDFFGGLVDKNINELRRFADPAGFTLTVFGSEPGIAVTSTRYTGHVNAR